ncbi:hypothetical protein KKC52_13825, partial [bacterium]|nr:hypothetical protein [bacterium]
MKNILKTPLFLAIVYLLLSNPLSVKAEEADTPSLRISKILFEGTSHEEEILKIIKAKPGDEFRQKVIREDVRSLYAS